MGSAPSEEAVRPARAPGAEQHHRRIGPARTAYLSVKPGWQ
ncbi:MAG: hypothetical protein JWQ99_1901 [Blastococcus sp.]|jgi:hypothetical protein|nr:hypothetical protein [Blastococcus sp.]